MNWYKIYYILLYCLTFRSKYRNLAKENWGKNNKFIIIDENGNSKEYPLVHSIKGLQIHWHGSNNTFTIELPTERLSRMEVHFYSNDNNVYIGKRAEGNHNLYLYNGNNNVKYGEKVSALGMTVSLNSGDLIIGNNCMISGFINVLTDGHSVIDAETKEVLNNTRSEIKIGNHVWIGFGATLLKNAKIAANSIVANSAVVTHAFEEENVVIAGNPAKIVKRGINWNHTAPVDYSIETADFSY